METTPIQHVLELIHARQHEEAWTLFLSEYGNLTFQVVRHFESDADNASDCFQFVSEQLVKDSFRRLRKFEPSGPARFSTWLRAVVRNLCIDWRRKEFGRRRTLDPLPQFTDLNHAAEAADPQPDPEAQTILHERRTLVNVALLRLENRDRLLLRLRFEEELTLDQIAKLLDLGNAQRVDRQIKHALALLNTELKSRSDRGHGKNSAPSVKAS